MLAFREQSSRAGFTEKLAAEYDRLTRKGWSQTKIERYAADRRKANERPSHVPSDSFDFWAGIVEALWRERHLDRVGLLLHFYSGDIASEAFAPIRRDNPPQTALLSALEAMRRDEITTFARP